MRLVCVIFKMGVDRTDFIMYGYKLNDDLDIWDDKFIEYIEWKTDSLALMDGGMNESPNMFGFVIESADKYEGFDVIELDFNIDNNKKEELIEKAKELFNITTEPKYFVFSRFS